MVNLFFSFFFAFFLFVSLTVCLVMPHPDLNAISRWTSSETTSPNWLLE